MIGVAFITHRIVTTYNIFRFILLIGYIEFIPNCGKVVVW